MDLRDDRTGTTKHCTIGEAETVAADAAEMFGVRPLDFYDFGQAHFDDNTTPGAWLFSVWDYSQTLSGTLIGAGDLVISYKPRNSQDPSPFTPSAFVPVRILYGTTSLDIKSCADTFWHEGRFVCRVPASMSLDVDSLPLRVVVSTAEGQSSASPMAGDHDLRIDFCYINYGRTAPGHWRFAFWGITVKNLKVTHGGPVTLTPEDIVISHARPFTDFANSPFIANRFPPLRIQYGSQQITIGRLTCVHHFYNGDRYECLLKERFNWDASNHPTEIRVNRLATAITGDAAAAPAHANPSSPPTAAPAAPTPTRPEPCPAWGHQNCPQPATTTIAP